MLTPAIDTHTQTQQRKIKRQIEAGRQRQVKTGRDRQRGQAEATGKADEKTQEKQREIGVIGRSTYRNPHSNKGTQSWTNTNTNIGALGYRHLGTHTNIHSHRT